MTPLRREWTEVRAACDGHWEKASGKKLARKTRDRHVKLMERKLLDFVERLAHVRILDPACGSGNFLYVAINLLLDLEKEVIAYGAARGVSMLPHVRPTQLHGIEINPYAQQLAQVVIWIGYLQWMHHNGFRAPTDPVLEPIETIHRKDAILDLTDPEHPKEPEWPEADFIVGNPPFLGGKLLRTHLGDQYVDQMFALWKDRVPHEADLCCYWFEKGREQIRQKKCRRAGLLATQGIRGGANRKVLERIKQSGDIFFAESDRQWILEGAAVHVSMVGFDDACETSRVLDGIPAPHINANLRSTADTTTAQRLAPNLNICYMADTKGGAFDITEAAALEMLRSPNPHGRPNSDVVFPWVNGLDVTRRPRGMWIIDFGVDMPVDEAARYEAPFRHVDTHVRPAREKNKRKAYRDRWWIHVEPRPAMRAALHALERFPSTISLGKHRLFVWIQQPTLPDHQLFAFARGEDWFFGVLHSRIHEVWALRLGTQLETRPRYTSRTSFETFPFPEPTDDQTAAISAAARELDGLRSAWLNPPEWTREEVLEFPGTADGPWTRYIDPATVECTTGFQARRKETESAADGLGSPSYESADGLGSPSYGGESTGLEARRTGPYGAIGTVRYPRTVPRDEECAKKLKKRTLTNLYNERPTWLDLAHKKLDEAVFAAYNWDPGMSAEELLEKLLALNLERGKTEKS